VSFRARVLIASVIVAVAPLALLTFGIRREVEKRLTAQYRARVDAAITAVRDDVRRQGETLDARLAALASGLEDDAGVRARMLHGEEAPAVIEWAGGAMPVAGLDYLLLLDPSGRVLSSGHFRNEYDRVAATLDAVLTQADGPVLVRARTAEGTFLALARGRGFELGGRRFLLAGGISADRGFLDRLQRGEEADGLAVALVRPPEGDGAPTSTTPTGPGPGAAAITAELPLPFVDDTDADATRDSARIVVTHSLAPLQALQRGMDLWFVAGLLGALVLAVVIARFVSARVSRPLTELAQKTRRLDLDRLDVDFRSTRRDEVGTLARLMGAMVERLRASVAQLRKAERRAAVGDMARQVNHDIRNGLLPIRNVVQHLSEVAHASPGELAGVFAEREGTLAGGIGYLEGLASTYAKLSPRPDRRPIDLNEVARTVVRDAAAPDGAILRVELDPLLPRVAADPVVLRRVVENLVVNALESLNGGGSVVVATASRRDAGAPGVTLTVTDTGSGMDAERVERIFEDYFTTKATGTGLGLSIVRRLVADLGGRIDVDSEPGRGSRFRVELPALEPTGAGPRGEGTS
jgi:signal transduction histidine kinase